jgi:hypothetical protein
MFEIRVGRRWEGVKRERCEAGVRNPDFACLTPETGKQTHASIRRNKTMETTNSSSQNRKSRRNAIIITTIAAAGLAGALGLGVIMGSRGTDAQDERSQVARPTSTATAINDDAAGQQPQLVGQVEGSV